MREDLRIFLYILTKNDVFFKEHFFYIVFSKNIFFTKESESKKKLKRTIMQPEQITLSQFTNDHLHILRTLRRPTQRELSYAERSLIQSSIPIYRRWGYRTGPQSTHQHYELLTHEEDGGRLLQEFTDIIFRNLWNLENEPLTFRTPKTDLEDKIFSAARYGEMLHLSERLQEGIREFYQRHKDLLDDIAYIEIEEGDSLMLIAIVSAALALKYLCRNHRHGFQHDRDIAHRIMIEVNNMVQRF